MAFKKVNWILDVFRNRYLNHISFSGVLFKSFKFSNNPFHSVWDQVSFNRRLKCVAKLYGRRTDIERLNGHLKELFLIDPLPIKRLKNVNTYLNLVMLSYLVCVYYNFTSQRPLREIKSLIA